MEEQELQQTDVQEAGSSDQQTVQEPQAQDTQETAPAQEATKEVPFHEHPRFKELVEQKNRYAEEAKSTAQRLQEMEQRLQQLSQPQQQAKQGNPMLERLKGIDPEFGEFMEKMYSDAQKVRELESWKAQREQADLRSQAVTELNKLHEANKVPANLRDLYNTQIQAAALQNPRLGLQDLPNLYKQVHETYSKLLDDVKRAERESYVNAKKSDAKAPTSQPKGTTVKPGPQPVNKNLSREERHKQIVKEIVSQTRSERNALGSP